MKRRSFIGAACGLFGGWMFGPKVLITLKLSESPVEPKPLPAWIPSGYKFAKMIKIHDQEWELFQFPCMTKRSLIDQAGKTWWPVENIQFFNQIVRRDNVVLPFFMSVVPGQVAECFRWESKGLSLYNEKIHQKMITMEGSTCWPI